MLLHLLVILLPLALVLFAPQPWAKAVAGWGLLAAGLLFLQDYTAHPAPYDDDFMDFNVGLAVGAVWAMTILGGLAFRHSVLPETEGVEERPGVLQWVQCWSIPIAFLIATAFLHWLSNRLAGAAPAWLIHLWVVLPALGLCLVLLRGGGSRMGILAAWRRLALALPAAFALLVAWDAHKGFGTWSDARAFAAGKPYCLMTYGGFEHRREARSGWDLSPLVDRHYGNWAVGKTPSLAVAATGGSQTFRYHGGRWIATRERAQCRPARAGWMAGT